MTWTDVEQKTVQLNIAIRHGHISDETKSKVNQKLDKLGRFFERLTSVVLTVDLKDPHCPVVQLNVSAEHKHDFVAQADSDNLLTAVDTVVQKVEQQLRKYKERVQDKHRTQEARRSETAIEDEDNPDTDL